MQSYFQVSGVYVYPHLNIHNSSTRSHASEEEIAPEISGANCGVIFVF
jgi:hypothetical protein